MTKVEDIRDLTTLNEKAQETVDQLERVAFGLAAEPELEHRLPAIQQVLEPLEAAHRTWRRTWQRLVVNTESRELFQERVEQELGYARQFSKSAEHAQLERALQDDPAAFAVFTHGEVERDVPAVDRLLTRWRTDKDLWRFAIHLESLDKDWPLFMRTERVRPDLTQRELDARRVMEPLIENAHQALSALQHVVAEHFHHDERRTWTLLSPPPSRDYF